MYAEDDAMKPDHKKALDAIADKVLAYRPKPKSAPARARKRRKAKLAKAKAKKDD
jgi:hypothetical protein